MRVAVVGGGPGGLYFARLLAKARPDAVVDLFDRGFEGATWGFGVGLGGRAMAAVASCDPEVHAELVASMRFTSDQVIRLQDEAFALSYSEVTGAIPRLELLRILVAACRKAGVRLNFRSTVASASELRGYDLVVAADGAGSRLRDERGVEFGTTRRTLGNRFAWFGVGRAMPMGLVFRTFEGGAFVGHHYAYSDDMSTFVAECDEATWSASGLSDMDDGGRKALMERVFAPELVGAPLIDNHSVWRRFPAIVSEHYHHGKVALVGDSLRVAHFSIGSGTRLAMEDAAALVGALREAGGAIGPALDRYQVTRSPARAKLGEAARLSYEWYERVADHMRQPLMAFIHSFVTRTGRIGDERLQSYAPSFHEAYKRYRLEVV